MTSAQSGGTSRLLLVLLTVLMVAAAVWYAVNRLPQTEPPPPAPVVVVPDSEPLTHLPPMERPCGVHCGTQRWAIKTLADADRDRVDLSPVAATVEELVSLTRPDAFDERSRNGPVELTTYRIRGYLGGWSNQHDGDVHLVVFGMVDQRVSLVAEIPNPGCDGVCPSGLAPYYLAARQSLEAILNRPNPEDRPIVVEVTGLGFWDRREHANGSAATGIELHPVLGLTEVR